MGHPMKRSNWISVHGGHSRDYCDHARDHLEDIIKRYIELGFAWVGITEHAPPPTDALRYPDEMENNISAAFLQERFARYMYHCRQLQAKYRDKINLLAGFETETWNGQLSYIQDLIQRFRPDYVVGSVHHVDDQCIDFSNQMYHDTARAMGGMDELYRRYFDQQYEMLCILKPAVAGHFDLIRIFDTDYEKRLKKPDIWRRVIRNLTCIKDLDIALDFNLRALKKGAREPYVSKPILYKALEMNIPVLPGDDSHGICDVGNHMEPALTQLKAAGGRTHSWAPPRLYNWNGQTHQS